MPKENASAGIDRQIAALAMRRHGIITTAQLHAVGLSASGITDRVNAGRLHRIHRGVYAVGHAVLSNEGRWMAAVLACGGGAVLSHQSAAALWRLLPVAGPTHVTSPRNGGRTRREGLRIHRSRTLLRRHRTVRDAIPVTTPTRTLADLRRAGPDATFKKALREAQWLRLPLGDHPATDGTRSELEARLLALCRRHGLPMPEVNVRVGPYVVDFLWRDARLIVEVDGWRSHGTPAAFEEDRARDAQLKVMGYTVVRFTWRQLTDDPASAVRTLRALLP